MARPEEICVRFLDKAPEFRNIERVNQDVADAVRAAAKERTVEECGDADPRMPVNVYMKKGTGGVVSPQVDAVGRVNTFNGKWRCEPAHFSGADDAKTAFNRQLDCVLEDPQYFWKYGSTSADKRAADLTGI